VDTPEFGFIAQELQEAQITTNTIYPNLVYDKNPDQLRISTEKLIPVMVKSIQELSATVEKQKADLREVTDILMKKINELSEEVRRLKSK
jgi:lipoate-protein ligase A